MTTEVKTLVSCSADGGCLSRLLTLVKRYDASIGGGCECCGSWVEFDRDDTHGEYVKYEELKTVVDELRKHLGN